ncbi:HOM3 [Candida oxycetoniae]|uniref:aspartate kinase n=1 Tax=Candida oxycetoniae TaxID=497107 RepID=A0AAI9WWR9_9ASCO|nr:HOM3 [Candida oxycetoniae]KAI3403536.2 HOM3 [Candida oxycetoniae]
MSRSPSLGSRSYNSVLDFKSGSAGVGGAGVSPLNSPSSSSESGKSQQGWIIQKFGGTSVGKFSEEIVEKIVKVFNQRNKVAVVCSARSSNTKSEGTTSRLIRSADLASNNLDFETVLEVIEQDHIENCCSKINSKAIRKQLERDIKFEIEHGRELLHACQVIGEISPRSLDSIMSMGEKLSCLYMTALMQDRDLNAVYINLSELIPVNYNFNNGFDDAFYSFISEEIEKRIRQVTENDGGEDVIPVITGYFGVVPGGLLNGAGRGYTDLCAALAAVGVQAEELQIWKEVDGIFTADPRKVPNARLLDSVTPEEAAELTYYGSEVIHPFTMEQVIKAKIPIRIKNVENPKGKGTMIYPDNIARRGEETPPHPPAAYETLTSSYISSHKKRSATAITAKQDIVVINIHSNKKTLSHGFLAQVFITLDKYKLVVDLISTSEVHVSMALSVQIEQEMQLKNAIQELKKMGSVDVTKKMTIISLVGKQMVNFIGIAGNMFKILADERINIEMISQGANEINISAVINEKDTLRALRAVHAHLLEGNHFFYESECASAVDVRLEALRMQ